ncbi:unnamed protein product, partial [Brenthis ino]
MNRERNNRERGGFGRQSYNYYRAERPPVEFSEEDKQKSTNNRNKGNKLSNRDKQRAEAYRERKNAATMDAIAEDFNKILHLGFASLANAVKDLSITQRTAKIVPVSTHAVGIIVRDNILRSESELQGRGQPLNYKRHAFYRVALAMVETKLYTQFKMRTALPYSSFGFGEINLPADLRDRCLGVKTHFLGFVNYLNSIGNLTVGDTPHYVGVPIAQTPFTITLGNLRTAVDAAFNGPPEVRVNLYAHNPFPFAVWGFDNEENPVLANAANIMPAGYAMNEFLQDVEVCQQYFELVNRKYPKRVSAAVNYELEGHKSILVSCQGDIRCADHVEDGVHTRPYIEGDVKEFWPSEPSTSDQDFYYSSLTMVGRVPEEDAHVDGFAVRSPVGAVKSGYLSARTNMSVHY